MYNTLFALLSILLPFEMVDTQEKKRLKFIYEIIIHIEMIHSLKNNKKLPVINAQICK